MKRLTLNTRIWLLLALCCCITSFAQARPFELITQLDPTQGGPAGGSVDSWAPIITPDGRYVVFASTANNLVVVSNNPLPVLIPPRMNVFLRDRSNATTALVSINLSGTGGGDGDSWPTGVSTNGRYVLFESIASDLVAGDTNNASDLFLRDMMNGQTILISASTNGGFANGASIDSVLTPDGAKIAFSSTANNLVANDTNGIADVFVRDWQAGVTTLVSVGAISTNSAASLGGSDSPQITPDGRYVAFFSTATNLVLGVTAKGGDVYIRDLVGATSYWASVSARAEMLSTMHSNNAVSYNFLLSTNGQYLAYEASPAYSPFGIILRYNLQSGLTDLVGTNAEVDMVGTPEDAYSLDMTPDGNFVAYVANTNGTTGSTTCLEVWNAATGGSVLASGDLNGKFTTNSFCNWPKLDSSGRYLAFLSSATNMVTNALVGTNHLYVRDLQAATTTLVDADTNGVGSLLSAATTPAMSADGSLVAFECPDNNLVPNDRNHDYDVFMRNLVAGTNEMISVHDPSFTTVSPNGNTEITAWCASTDGRYIAFASDADNLVANDTNGCSDVFVRDLVGGTNNLVSVAAGGAVGANGASTQAAISADGRYVAFTSTATNLVAGDTNKASDVFLRALQAGTTLLVSFSAGGAGSANGGSYSPVISTNGSAILYRSLAGNLGSTTFSVGTENLIFYNVQSASNYVLTTSGLRSGMMTPDGRLVAFVGNTGNLYVWNSQSATIIYTNSSAVVTNAGISPSGTWVVYSTSPGLSAVNLVTGSNVFIGPPLTTSRQGLQFSSDERFLAYTGVSQNTNQVYLYDFQAGVNLLLSQSYNLAGPANGPSDSPTISPDGRFVVYRSLASNIVANANNTVPDLFLYDRLSGSTTLLTASRFSSSSADNRSLDPVFSGDDQTLLLASRASDLVAGDFNSGSDVFAYPFFYVSLTVGANPQLPALSWQVIPDLTYHVQFKNNLSDAAWQENGNVTIVGNKGYFNDPTPGSAQRFYRVVAY